MKKPNLFVLGILLYLPSLLWSQVRILPEIGFSYLPFTYNTATTSNPSKNVDFLFGISAQMPIHKNFELSTRISYADRQDIKWRDLFFSGYLEGDIRHEDLNFDLSILYSKNKNIHFGLGPSAIRKFAEQENWYKDNEELNTLYTGGKFIFGLNSNVVFVFHRMGIKFNYVRIFFNVDRPWAPIGQNRFDMTVFYDFFKKS